MLTYILLAIGFVILLFGANWLVTGAASIAKRYQIPDLMIGLTIVAFGTSAPELAVNLFAISKGTADIAIGNILGSNIFNTLFILGIAALIYPLRVQHSTTWKEVPFSLLAAVALGIAVNDIVLGSGSSNILGRTDGLLLLGFFIIFIYYTVEIAKKTKTTEEAAYKATPLWKSIGLVIIGLAGLILGGQWIVNGAIQMASSLGMGESIIGLTVVAAGTSLPELATSVVAAIKRNTDIAVGNVVGSNIFNIFFILGITATVSDLPFPPQSNIDIGMVILSSILLFLFIFTGKNRSIERWEGIILLCCYVIYTIYLILRL